MSLYGSTPRASSSIPSFAIASRRILDESLRRVNDRTKRSACGALLISIWPPGSNEMRVPSGSSQDGGSFADRLLAPALRAAQTRDGMSAVDAPRSFWRERAVRVVA